MQSDICVSDKCKFVVGTGTLLYTIKYININRKFFLANYRCRTIKQVNLHERKAVRATKNVQNKIETENIVASLTKRSKQPYQFVAE